MTFVTQRELAARWHISPRTLEQWRWLGRGPKFVKIGARVLYRLADVEDYEVAQVCQNTVGPISGEQA